jgi:hypothetical protein
MAVLTKSAHGRGRTLCQPESPYWLWGRQVTRAVAESSEATAGGDAMAEEGSTGDSLGQLGGRRGRGRKRKANEESAGAQEEGSAVSSALAAPAAD